MAHISSGSFFPLFTFLFQGIIIIIITVIIITIVVFYDFLFYLKDASVCQGGWISSKTSEKIYQNL